MGYRLFCICVLCILGAVSLARQQCVRETKSSELAAAVAHSSLSVEDHQAQCLLLLAGTSGHLISSLPDGGNSASPGSATTVELKPNVCYLEVQPQRAPVCSFPRLATHLMTSNAHNGPLRAEQVLSTSSEREALDLDGVPEGVTIHRVATASSHQHQHAFTLAWRRYISLSVPHVKCRDHLANERTALGWIRTGQAFAMMGVFIAQLMRLFRSPNPDPVLGFFAVSVPLSLVCHVMAIITTILGCYRYLHWQSEMARGDAISSGWELIVVFMLTILVLLCIFVLVVVISIRNDDR